MQLRSAILKATGNAEALSNCAGEARREGLREEEQLAKAMIDKAVKERRTLPPDSQALLDAISIAMSSGNLTAAASARDTARDAGLSRKDISRAFALGSTS